MNGASKRYLLDTNAVVSLLRGHPDLLELTKQAEWLGVSVITYIEFLAFPQLAAEDIALFTRFLERVEVVNLAQHEADLITTAIALRQQHRLKLPDAVIAASAIIKDAALVTADQRLLRLAARIPRLRLHEFAL